MSVPTLNPPDVPDERAGERGRLGAVTGSRSGGALVAADRTADLARRMFHGPERWGWEFVEPAPVEPYDRSRYPRWAEPPGPDTSRDQYALDRARAELGKRIAIAAFVLLVGMLLVSNVTGPAMIFAVLVLLGGAGIIGWASYAIAAPQRRIREAAEKAQAHRDAVYQDFLQVCGQWDQRIAQHDADEQRRFSTDPLLFPLAPRVAARVDVVGGTRDGWRALLSTTGSSMLAEGSTVLVLDLTGDDVAGPLLELAVPIGVPAQTAAVPADLDRDWLLGGLDARELADVLAEAMDAERAGGPADLRSMDVELVQTVARRLAAPVTFERLAAGVRVLRSTYEEDETSLSAVEIAALTDRIDLVGRSERMRDELGFVEAQLKVLADSERAAAADGGTATGLWPDDGLGIVRSDEHEPRRKTFVDRVLVGAVAHHLSTSRLRCPNPVLIVAGADEMGRNALESLARKASRAGVRLVYLFDHLRDDVEALVGGGGGAVVLMKLGNGREATAAADFVGRTHTFQLSQLSRQHGLNETNTTSRSTTVTNGESVSNTTGGSTTTSRGGSSGGGGGRNWSQSVTDTWSRTLTESWSTAQTTGESFSKGRSETDGVVVQRSYDFRVEPAQIQDLEETTFLVVDTGPGGRRVRMADCFPGAVYVPRISPTPR